MRRLSASLGVAVLGLSLIGPGCAHAPPAPAKPRETRVHMDPVLFEKTPTGEVRTIDARALFDDAAAAFAAANWDEALRLYDDLVARFPDSSLAAPALYNAGLTLEKKGDATAAVERYKQIVARRAAGVDTLDAEYRLGATLAGLGRWKESGEVFAVVLKRTGPCRAPQACELTVSDRVEALARRGAAQLETGELDPSERTLRQMQELYKQWEKEERLDTDYFLGMGAYYLARVVHERFHALPLRPPESRLAADLEEKARTLLVAQRRYLDAMRVNNGEWATAAGYQIARMYRELWDAMVGAPIPPELAKSADGRQIYLETLKKRIRPLLEKAASTHEKNLLMAERIGVKNDWVKRSNEEMEQLRALLEPGVPAATAPRPDEPAPVTPEAPPPTPLPVPRPRDTARPPL